MKIPKLPHGEGSMYQHSDTLLAYRKTIILPNGRKTKKTVYGKSASECMKKMREAERELEESNLSANKILLIDGILQWLDNTHQPTVKPQTYQRLVGTARNQIEPSRIGHRRYQDISSEEIQHLINELNKKGMSHSVIKKTYNLLGAFYRYASAKDGFNNPMLLVNMPKMSNILAETKEVEWFEKDDIDRFIEACGARYNNGNLKYKFGYILAANIFLGLRGGELLALQWKDIDLEANTIYVSKTLIEYRDLDQNKTHFEIQNSTKRNMNRYVPINAKAKELILKHWDNCRFTNPNDFVISTSNQKTTTLTVLSEMIRKIEEEGNTTVRAHNTHILRHTCASLYFRAGVRVEVICRILGNSREVCERTYIHFVEEQLKDAASQTVRAINFF